MSDKMPRKPKVGDHIIRVREGIQFAGHVLVVDAIGFETNMQFVFLFSEYGQTWRFADETPELEPVCGIHTPPFDIKRDAQAKSAGYSGMHDPFLADETPAPIAARKPRELTDNECDKLHLVYMHHEGIHNDAIREQFAAYEAMRPGLLDGGGMRRRVHSPNRDKGTQNVPFKPFPREPKLGDRVVDITGIIHYPGVISAERYRLSNGFDQFDIRRDDDGMSTGYCVCNYGLTWILEDGK